MKFPIPALIIMAVIGILMKKGRFTLNAPHHLILRRSNLVKYYKDMDSVVTGFYDGSVSPEEQMYFEFAEEIGQKRHDLIKIAKTKPVERSAYVDGKKIKWVDHGFIYMARGSPEITLNPENVNSSWRNPGHNLQLPPDISYAFNEFRNRGYDL